MLTQGVVGFLLVAVLLAGALLRERLRLRALEARALQAGLTMRLPFAPDPAVPLDALAVHLHEQQRPSHGLWSPRWGAGLTGQVDGHDVVIAEHEAPDRAASSTRGFWYATMVWRTRPGAGCAAGQRAWPHGGEIACQGGWAAWRLQGTLDAPRLERLLQNAPEALRWFR